MMGLISEINAKFTKFFEPIWNKIVQFLNKGEKYYLLYAAIIVLLIILILPGLYSFLKRAPKFFIFILFLLGIVVGIWYFFILKK